MKYFANNCRTAIIMMAVLASGLILSGCVATQHDAAEIKAKLTRIESSQANFDNLAARMDSLLSSGAEADNKLRNDLRFSVDELNQQLSILLENYNELLVKINEINSQRGVQILRPSVGASDTTSHVVNNNTPTGSFPVESSPSVDCTVSFEIAFTSHRQNQYDSSIAQFKRFFEVCPEHEKTANGHFWLGESYYFSKKYAEAVAEFEVIVADYQDWPDMGQVIYKIARNKEEQGKTAEAKTLYQKVIDEYPDTFNAKQAAEKLKDI